MPDKTLSVQIQWTAQKKESLALPWCKEKAITIRTPLIAIGVSVLFGLVPFGIAPHFWFVIVVPSALFLVLQFVAFNSWFDNKKIFIYTEYVYYVVIVAALGLGVRFFYLREPIANLNAYLNAQADQTRLDAIEAEIPVLGTKLAAATKQLSDLEKQQPCRGQLPFQGAIGYDQPPQALPEVSPCRAYLNLVGRVDSIPKDIETLENEKKRVSQRLKDNPVGPSKKPTEPNPKIAFMYSPMILLCGVALKLGKTTHALVSQEKPVAPINHKHPQDPSPGDCPEVR